MTHIARHSFWALALLALLAAGSSQAQTAEDAFRFSERFPATGARMIGLSGAGTAGLADASALFSNPAGLGYFSSSEVSGALSAFSTTNASTFQVPGMAGVSAFDGDATRAYGLGNAAYIYKAPTTRGSLVFGAAFNQTNTFEQRLDFRGDNAMSSISTALLPFDDEFSVGSDGTITFTNDRALLAFEAGLIDYQPSTDPNVEPFLEAVAPGTTIEQTGTLLQEGSVSELSFGGAAEAAQGVMVGLSVNLAFGQYRFTETFDEFDIDDENGPAEYTVFLGDDEYAGFQNLTVIDAFESDLLGVNVRGGISAEVTSGLRLGLSLESPTYYSVNEEFETVMSTTFDEVNGGAPGTLVYGGEPGDPLFGEFDYTIQTPWRLGAGLAYTQGPFTVSADAEFVDWSRLRLEADGDAFLFEAENDFIREAYDVVANVRIGGELRLGNAALRAGIAAQPDPRKDTIDNPRDIDRERTFFSLGLGYELAPNVHLDLGWMQTRFDDRYQPYTDARLFADQEAPLVEEEVIRNRFALGLRFGF